MLLVKLIAIIGLCVLANVLVYAVTAGLFAVALSGPLSFFAFVVVGLLLGPPSYKQTRSL